MQQASDCDMVLTHDDDLVTINGLCYDAVSGLLNSIYFDRSFWQLESFEPEVMMDLLRRSNVEIDKVLCGELSNLIESRLVFSRGLPHPKICPRMIVVQTPIRMLSR
jgi:hypothetical protein